MDAITIRELAVPTHIGVTEAERKAEQTLLITLKITADLSRAGASDDIGDTIDYDAVATAVKNLGKKERKTVENFAEDVASLILSHFKPESVSVTVWKFIRPDTRGISVTITRSSVST